MSQAEMGTNTMRTILFLASVSVALAQPSSQGVNFYSVEKEIELGKQLASETQASLQAQPDARLQTIGDRLAAKAGGAYQYHFFVYPAQLRSSNQSPCPAAPSL